MYFRDKIKKASDTKIKEKEILCEKIDEAFIKPIIEKEKEKEVNYCFENLILDSHICSYIKVKKKHYFPVNIETLAKRSRRKISS